MVRDANLGNFEHMVLLTLVRLGGRAHGMAVRRELEAVGGRSVTIGAVYATLDRLESKGLLTSIRHAPSAGQGGPTRRLFEVAPNGERALAESRAVLDRLWHGVTIDSGRKASR